MQLHIQFLHTQFVYIAKGCVARNEWERLETACKMVKLYPTKLIQNRHIYMSKKVNKISRVSKLSEFTS